MSYTVTVGPNNQVNVSLTPIAYNISVGGLADAEITAKVTAAQTAASGAADSEAQALAYRDTAEDHKDDALIHRNAAETASANALAAVTYQNLSGAEATLAVDASAVWKGVWAHMPLSEQVTKSWYADLGPKPTSVLVIGQLDEVTVYSLDTGTPVAWDTITPTAIASGQDVWRSSRNLSSVHMCNGVLYVGIDDSGASSTGFAVYDYPADKVRRYSQNASSGEGEFFEHEVNGIVQGTLPQIADNAVNAIATYTAANAPLNEAGLPISVVPVGTYGGLSVILEDGTVNNSASTVSVVDVLAHDQGVHWITTSGLFFATWDDIRSGDGFGDQIGSTTAGAQAIDLLVVPEKIEGDSGQIRLFGQTASGTAVAGVMDLWPNYQSAASSISKVRTTNFATPVMFGDVKGSYLQEADDTDLVESNLWDDVLLSNDGNWTDNLDGTYTSDGNTGLMRMTVPGASFAAGDQVAFEFEILDLTAGSCSNPYDGSGANRTQYTAVQSYAGSFIAANPNQLYVYSSGFAGTIGNIRVTKALPDRSVNGKGLILGPDPLAAAYINGGKTVGYGPITPTNFPRQPYNADMDAGTGDYLYRAWARFNPGQSTMAILSRTTSGTTGLQIFKDTSSSTSALQVRHAANTLTGSIALDNGQWRCLTVLRRNGVVETYIEDVLDILATETSDISDTEPMLEVGYCTANPMVHNLTGKSIFSFSLGAPTAEQVRVAYLAERPRFHGGAVDPTLPETALDMSLDEVTGLLWMIGATKVWAMDGNGILAASTLADKGTAAHNRIDVHEGEVSTWEYAG